MTPEQDYLVLLTGRTVAHDVLLRALYAQWASSAADPEQFIVATVEGIIGSVDAAKQHPRDDAERRVWEVPRANSALFWRTSPCDCESQVFRKQRLRFGSHSFGKKRGTSRR